MKSRILFVAVAALALSAGSAMAQAAPQGGQPQGQGAPGSGAQRRMQMMLQNITLTPDQQSRIDSINTRYQAQMPAMTPGQPMDSAARAQRMAIGQQRDAEIRAVLTPDQQKTWDQNAEQVRAQMQQRRPPGN